MSGDFDLSILDQPFNPHEPAKEFCPVDPVFVLDNGIRIPIKLEYRGSNTYFSHVWRPIIEGDVVGLMPVINRLDATPPWPPSTAIEFPLVNDDRKMSVQWAERIVANSPILTHSRLK